ncbi:LemA family protein [Bacillus horti]|uniref:LemA protein n=2 Tax=Caldalkalibacillus horti TaxID=77523 RepID=A0ABT9W4U6_9BACI|nr:LemA family protein [Bacillus horti]MDQ0168278.1 LemA protein [Bacillus horti]
MEFIIIGAVVLVGLYLIISYNRLISVRNRVRESFQSIDVYLQQRFDALTQIAETVAAYSDHERGTLKDITQLRQSIYPDMPEDQKIQIYNELERTAATINVERYPELKANENYIQLQRTINDLEEKISASRRTFNANVTKFNTMIETIPTNLFAGMMGFQRKTMLEIDDAKKQDVDLRGILRG